MSKTKVTLHSGGMDDLLKEPGVSALLEDIAGRVAATARASAPVESGTYRGSIESGVVPATAAHIPFRKSRGRPVGVVHSSAHYSLDVEAATGNLARALDSA